MLNKIQLHGRLTSAPDLRQTNSGKAVATFTLAVDRDKDSTDFIPCVAWEKRAENAHAYFGKGQEAVVCGRLTTRKYEAKDGTTRTAYEVVVETMDFCGKRMEAPEKPISPRPVFTDLPDDGGDLPL